MMQKIDQISNEVKFYELTYLITPSDLSEEEVNVFSEKINIARQKPGRRALRNRAH